MIIKPDDLILDYYRYQRMMITVEQEVRQFLQKYEYWQGGSSS